MLWQALRGTDRASGVPSSPRSRSSINAGEEASGGMHEVPLDNDHAGENKVDASAPGTDPSTGTKVIFSGVQDKQHALKT